MVPLLFLNFSQLFRDVDGHLAFKVDTVGVRPQSWWPPRYPCQNLRQESVFFPVQLIVHQRVPWSFSFCDMAESSFYSRNFSFKHLIWVVVRGGTGVMEKPSPPYTILIASSSSCSNAKA